jgi:hypothetical protein
MACGHTYTKEEKKNPHSITTQLRVVKLEDEDKKKVMSYAQRLHIIGSDYK